MFYNDLNNTILPLITCNNKNQVIVIINNTLFCCWRARRAEFF